MTLTDDAKRRAVQDAATYLDAHPDATVTEALTFALSQQPNGRHFTNVQEALNHAGEGDRILVGPNGALLVTAEYWGRFTAQQGNGSTGE